MTESRPLANTQLRIASTLEYLKCAFGVLSLGAQVPGWRGSQLFELALVFTIGTTLIYGFCGFFIRRQSLVGALAAVTVAVTEAVLRLATGHTFLNVWAVVDGVIVALIVSSWK